MKRAGNIPTDVILFNIDSKASLDNADEKDKILSVFEKVFNEKQGLSTIPHVAELERFLIKNNKYDDFKAEILKECKDDWQSVRNDFYFKRDEIVEVYSKVMNNSSIAPGEPIFTINVKGKCLKIIRICQWVLIK